jgi:hypothetical protein
MIAYYILLSDRVKDVTVHMYVVTCLLFHYRISGVIDLRRSLFILKIARDAGGSHVSCTPGGLTCVLLYSSESEIYPPQRYEVLFSASVVTQPRGAPFYNERNSTPPKTVRCRAALQH